MKIYIKPTAKTHVINTNTNILNVSDRNDYEKGDGLSKKTAGTNIIWDDLSDEDDDK